MNENRRLIMDRIDDERNRQDAKWGEQNHSPIEWLAILMEEVGEVSKEALEKHFKNHYDEGGAKYEFELIQCAAVCIAMLECLERNIK